MRGCSRKKMERAVKILRKGGGEEEEEEEERRSLSLSSSTSIREIGGEDDGYPQPMEGLKEVGPPPFLKKTYEMVEDASTDDIVSWSQSHNSFVVWDSHKFSTTLLPKYFKHNNFSSFIRQLNTYGFRKVDSDRWEFANEGFLAGQKHLLKTIKRRRRRRMSMQEQQQVVGVGGCCVEVGKFGLETEIDMLRRDRNVLMTEILKLRQQQHKSRKQLILMEERLLNTETKQQQMMTFLAKALNNPSFIHQFLQLQQRTTSSNGLPAAGVEVGRKRRLTTTASPSSENLLQPSQREAVSVPTEEDEEEEEDDLASMESDFETFFSAAAAAINDESSTDVQHNPVSTSSGSLGPLSETMWEDLLNEDLMTGDGNPGGEEKDDDVLVTKPSPEWGEDNLHLHLHLHDLVDQMGFLGSKS